MYDTVTLALIVILALGSSITGAIAVHLKTIDRQTSNPQDEIRMRAQRNGGHEWANYKALTTTPVRKVES